MRVYFLESVNILKKWSSGKYLFVLGPVGSTGGSLGSLSRHVDCGLVEGFVQGSDLLRSQLTNPKVDAKKKIR